METGVAILGHYEDEAFDRHNIAQEHTTFDGGLTESVSFGRFAVDSHSWVKRSSFNHNQYLEELGNCSTPGSVRQKKAYFEAYYKAIAKRKALENALAAEGISNGHAIEEEARDIDNKESKPEYSFTASPDAGNACLSMHMADNAANACPSMHTADNTGILNEGDTNSCSDNEESVEDPSQDLNLAQLDNDFQASIDPHESLSDCLLQSQDNLSTNATEFVECMLDIVVENHSDVSAGKLQHGRGVSLDTDRIEPDNIAITSLDDGGVITSESSDINVLDNLDDKHDAQIIDKFEMSEISGQEPYHSPPVQNLSSHSVVSHKKAPGLPKQTHPQPMLGNAKVKASSNAMPRSSSPALKLNRGSVQRGQDQGGLIEVKTLTNTTGLAHMNVTVPQPFALATNKRAALFSSPQEECGTKISDKPVHKGSLRQFPPLKNAQAPPKSEKKPSGRMSVTDENAKLKGTPEQRLIYSSELKRGVTSRDSKKQEVTAAVKEQKQGGLKTNGLTEPCQHGGRKLRPSPVKSSTFSFKCDERAEKRKEFNSKVEAKITAKVAEKNQAEAKTQEEAEEEIKQLRKSLRFKATPMPNFYQESGQLKMENKKAVIPTTRAKSPKLGRKTSASVECRSLSTGPADASSAPKQATRACVLSDGKESSGIVTRTRNATVQSKKPSEGPGVVEEESPRNQSLGVDVKIVGAGMSDLDRSGVNFKPSKNFEEQEPKGSIGSESVVSSAKHNFEENGNERAVGDDSADLKERCSEATPSKEVIAVDHNGREKGHVVSTEHCNGEISLSKERSKRETCVTQGKIPKRDITPRRGGKVLPGSSTVKPRKDHPSKQSLKHLEDLDRSKSSSEIHS